MFVIKKLCQGRLCMINKRDAFLHDWWSLTCTKLETFFYFCSTAEYKRYYYLPNDQTAWNAKLSTLSMKWLIHGNIWPAFIFVVFTEPPNHNHLEDKLHPYAKPQMQISSLHCGSQKMLLCVSIVRQLSARNMFFCQGTVVYCRENCEVVQLRVKIIGFHSFQLLEAIMKSTWFE